MPFVQTVSGFLKTLGWEKLVSCTIYPSHQHLPRKKHTESEHLMKKAGREGAAGGIWHYLGLGLQSGLRNENPLLQTPAPGALPRESHCARCVLPREESSRDSKAVWKCCHSAFPPVRAWWSLQATHPPLAVGDQGSFTPWTQLVLRLWGKGKQLDHTVPWSVAVSPGNPAQPSTLLDKQLISQCYWWLFNSLYNHMHFLLT